jgi:hypothetical protein
MGKSIGIRAAFTIAGLLIAGAAAAGPLALAGLSGGRWQLHEIGSTAPARFVCVREPIELIQLNHPGIQCTRFMLDDVANHVTIQYNCQGKGYGRTSIRVEEPELIRLETQGFGPDGQPFDTAYEGRRLGTCNPQPIRR